MAMRFNWDYLYYKLKEKGYTANWYSENKLGKSSNYISYYKSSGRYMPKNMITFMVKDLELDENILYEIDEPNVEKVVQPETTEIIEPSIAEMQLAMMKIISDKLDRLINKKSSLEKILKLFEEV